MLDVPEGTLAVGSSLVGLAATVWDVQDALPSMPQPHDGRTRWGGSCPLRGDTVHDMTDAAGEDARDERRNRTRTARGALPPRRPVVAESNGQGRLERADWLGEEICIAVPGPPRSRRWNLTEMTLLCRMAAEGRSVDDIARALGRTVTAIRIKAAQQRVAVTLTGKQRPPSTQQGTPAPGRCGETSE